MGDYRAESMAGLALIVGAAAALLVGCGGARPPIGAPSVAEARAGNAVPQWEAQHLARADCPQVVGRPTCTALRVLSRGVLAGCSPSSTCGYTPAELQTAYGLTPSLGNGAGTKIAVIEAGDLANAASDLSTYRSQYGLGAASFVKYNENGQQSNYPPSCKDYGWCGETALDIEMISASCPKCTIYLMEAKDGSSISDFEQAEKEAVTLGATVLSNSWSCPENWDCGDSNFDSYFDAPGIAYLASTGDHAYNTIGGPAALGNVLAVGGTQLENSGSTYKEAIWADASSGCASPSVVGSPGVSKPSWQHDPDCAYRTVGDVSSESGCSPGVAVYVDVYGGWSEYCGTSVASPFTAGVIGLAGNADIMDGGKTFWSFNSKQHKKYFHHPTGGDCRGNYLGGCGRYKKYYSGPGAGGRPAALRAISEAAKVRTSASSRHIPSIIVAAALLAGCGGSQLPIGASGAMPQSRATTARADRSGSWMLLEASGEDLLYVSNGPASSHNSAWVTVYSYPRGKLVGVLRGFALPGGECVDGQGNIFITDTDTGKIFEYAHGGNHPIATLQAPGPDALGCSVDPATGNLAVSSLGFGDDGGVGIYKGPKAAPSFTKTARSRCITFAATTPAAISLWTVRTRRVPSCSQSLRRATRSSRALR